MDAAERSLNAAFDRLTWRARTIAAAEAAAWGVAVAPLSLAGGVLIAAAVGLWFARRVSRGATVRHVDRVSAADNVFVTADELLRGELRVSSPVRARVLADAERRQGAIAARGVFSLRGVWRAMAAAAVCWTIVAVVASTGRFARTPNPESRVPNPESRLPSTWHLTVTIQPPAYTSLPRTVVNDPAELRVVEGSTIALRATQPIETTRDGAASETTFVATRSGAMTVMPRDGGTPRLIPVVVSPDALPVVRIAVPGRDLVFADGSPNIEFSVHATDDFGLRSLTLEYTKVSGSGEEYTFNAGAIPLTMTRASGRDWTGTASRTLNALGLKDGDMLVYRAAASDAKPGDRLATSDAFFVEISTLGVAAGEAFTLPEEETRYALSEQMLIVKTERLLRERPSLAAEAVTERLLNLAVEQRRIRAEFVFMLGGEIEDEDVEAEQSIELQAGRLANRGQRDLRDATRAMSRAETLLTGGDPASALSAERVAVEALQRAFARDRYLLRALATRAQLDPSRRLTGDRHGARDTRQPLPPSPENRRAAQIVDLLRGIGDAAGRTADRSRLLVLAASAIAIDPDSNVFRDAAADLQRGALDAASIAVAGELRRVLADPPAALPLTSPDLARALERARTEQR
jgi:hypothetical protein